MTNESATIVNLPTVQAADYDPLSPAHFEHSQRVAKMFASSELVPQHLRGKLADCLIAYAIAKRTREEPLVVLQNIYFVSGRAGWSAQYMIAKANRSGVFSRRINWRVEGAGENMRVTAFATLADSGEVVEATASMAMAKAEGWTRNTKYQTMPDQMLRYRSAAMLIRLFCPEVMMGLPMVDEVEDIAVARGPAAAIDITPGAAASAVDAILSADAGSAPPMGEHKPRRAGGDRTHRALPPPPPPPRAPRRAAAGRSDRRADLDRRPRRVRRQDAADPRRHGAAELRARRPQAARGTGGVMRRFLRRLGAAGLIAIGLTALATAIVLAAIFATIFTPEMARGFR